MEYLKEALKIEEETLPSNYSNIAIIYNNIGITYGKLGEYEKELKYLMVEMLMK